MKDLLASCPILERLVLAKCGDFVDLVVSSDSLKYFFLEEWQSLESVELIGANLSTFEYRGRQVRFSFDKVPRLERLFLFKDSVHLVAYALNTLPIDAPHIKTLIMCVSSPREVSFHWKVSGLLLFVITSDDSIIYYNYFRLLSSNPVCQ